MKCILIYFFFLLDLLAAFDAGGVSASGGGTRAFCH
jgi:hypothetical protein